MDQRWTLPNIMVDIETFGRRPNGLVVEIGAVAFDLSVGLLPIAPENVFHATLAFAAAASETRFERNPETMTWWASEDQAEAYGRLQERMKASRLDMKQLIEAFSGWLTPWCQRKAKIWGNSPSFDLVMIENAAKQVGAVYPPTHRSENDYRTLTDLVYGSENKPRPPKTSAHDGLEDARFQAQVCIEALKKLARWRALDP